MYSGADVLLKIDSNPMHSDGFPMYPVFLAITEMVLDLILAPYFFGPQEI